MKGLCRTFAAWTMARRRLCDDLQRIAAERDAWEEATRLANDTSTQALAVIRSYADLLAAEQAKSASLAATLDDLVGVQGVAW